MCHSFNCPASETPFHLMKGKASFPFENLSGSEANSPCQGHVGQVTQAWPIWWSRLSLWIASKRQKEIGTVWNSFQEASLSANNRIQRPRWWPEEMWEQQSQEGCPNQATPAARPWLWFFLPKLPAFLPVHRISRLLSKQMSFFISCQQISFCWS